MLCVAAIDSPGTLGRRNYCGQEEESGQEGGEEGSQKRRQESRQEESEEGCQEDGRLLQALLARGRLRADDLLRPRRERAAGKSLPCGSKCLCDNKLADFNACSAFRAPNPFDSALVKWFGLRASAPNPISHLNAFGRIHYDRQPAIVADQIRFAANRNEAAHFRRVRIDRH
jgi:hypothetical protein